LVWKGIASFNPKLGFVWQVFRSEKMTLPQEAGGRPISHFSLLYLDDNVPFSPR
jgi:hypothetical protein